LREHPYRVSGSKPGGNGTLDLVILVMIVQRPTGASAGGVSCHFFEQRGRGFSKLQANAFD
jgi:hypothetical protein